MSARFGTLALALGLISCAQQPLMAMRNPRTGITVGCPMPDRLADSGGFLVSRACLSACAAHGFRPVPGSETQGSIDDTPTPCLN